MKKTILLFLVIIFGCDGSHSSKKTQVIFHGGDIITMEGEIPNYVESVVVEDGKIIFTGNLEEADKKFPKAKKNSLEGKTMLPGFLDPHSHFMFAVLMSDWVNLAVPPVGQVTNIESLLQNLNKHKDENKVSEGDWIVGWGYDNEEITEKRHITKFDIDRVLPNHKVMVIHVSGHGAVFNSEALRALGIDEKTPTPEGGVINRVKGTNEPSGLLMEAAFMPIFEKKMSELTDEQMFERLESAQLQYAREGYTHAQEGFTSLHHMDFLLEAAKRKKLFLDIVSLPGFLDVEKWINNPKYEFGKYNNHLKFQGIKITQDGSPQGKTAHVCKPYLTGGPNGEKNWTAQSILPTDKFEALVKKAFDNNLQVFVHANGDCAIDEVIHAVEHAGISAKDDRRTVVVHSQFQRPEQLDKYLELGITPSYFTNHTFFWGDIHVRNIGEEAADFISPLKTSKQKGIISSNHTDFNITPLDPFFTIWTAVVRESKSGKIIGENERVDVYTALQEITTGAAYQVFEENTKGKIKEGFNADFVIMDKNPIKVEVSEIKNIEVLETIKDGNVIFKK